MSKFELHNQRNEHLYRILHNEVSGLTTTTQDIGGLLAMLVPDEYFLLHDRYISIAGIKWDRAVVDEDEEGNEDVQYSAWKWKNDWLRNRHPVRCWQEPGWPECMALMLVMIEVAQLAREDGNNIQNAG